MDSIALACTGALCSVKKIYFLTVLFFAVGIVQVKSMAQGININLVKDWGILLAAFGAVAYIVSISKDVESYADHMALELASRDVKIDLAYSRAILGGRFTAADGAAMETKCEGKFQGLAERLNAKNARISRIEEHIKDIDRRIRERSK